ncbi:MAG: addiction module protein [Gemmatimonadales bacterium]|nr:addiction module protein [Gemmatimonadales bacterium]
MANKPTLQFDHLSLPERLQLVEDIWDSIAAEAEVSTLPLSEEEKALLDKRLADLAAHPEAGASWEDVRARIEQLGR